ncbi:MAG: alpha/beta fold hydrolase [Nevskia sp.]|nr:alpha/beta fold hydrolase [Nevskia sp.]
MPHPAPLRQPHVEFVRIGGQHIRTARWAGNSPLPLLIFNGIGGNFEILEPLVDALGDHEVLMFDAPGAGASSTPSVPYGISAVARLGSLLLKRYHYDRADVMGVSWGGAAALAFARGAPHRCRRLILCATMAGGGAFWPGKPGVMMRMMSPKRYLSRRYMHDHIGALYGGRFRDDAEFADAYIRRMRRPSQIGYALQVAAISTWSSLPWIRSIRHPTLVLHGKDDPIVPAINARIMKTLLRNAELQLVDDGHLLLVAQAAESARRIREFLA